MDVLHFLFWINTIIHVLPKVSIRKFTGFHNLEYKKKYTVYIGTILSLCNFVGVQEETALLQMSH